MEVLSSGLPEQIAPEEDIARFLTQSSHFNSLMAKPAAFLPSRKDRETSVSRHGTEPPERLWELGRAAAGTRPLYGAAVFKAATVATARLEISSDEPPERHAVIRKWPLVENDPELEKAQQLEAASVLASRSTLILAPV